MDEWFVTPERGEKADCCGIGMLISFVGMLISFAVSKMNYNTWLYIGIAFFLIFFIFYFCLATLVGNSRGDMYVAYLNARSPANKK